MECDDFELLGAIAEVEQIASGRAIRELRDLQAQYGVARWRKLKGIARVRLSSGMVYLAELHWYEAHGVGRRRLKIKRLLD